MSRRSYYYGPLAGDYQFGPFVPPGSGGGFNPWEMTNLALLLVPKWESGGEPAAVTDQAQNPSLISGQALATLTDWSGNGNHLLQASGTNQPVWDVDGSGNIVYVFSGNQYATAGIRMTETCAVAAVFEKDAATTLAYLYHAGVPLGNPSQFTLLGGTAGTQNLVHTRNTNTRTASGPFNETGIGRFNVQSAALAEDMTATWNDVDLITTIAAGPAVVSFDSVQNFQLATRSGSFPLRGKIHAFAYFHSTPDPTELADFNAWADTEFGL